MSEEEPGGSPPCLACEMDEAYGGFLPPEELAAALVRLARLAEIEPDPIRKRWLETLEPALARLPAPDSARIAPDPADADLRSAARRLLPRIADDGLHAAVRALLES